MNSKVLFIVVSCMQFSMFLAKADSTSTAKPSVRTFSLLTAGCAFNISTENKEEEKNRSSIFVIANLDGIYKKKCFRFDKNIQFHSALGFAKSSDSIWIKNLDYWKFSILFSENKNKTFSESYSLIIKSQFLNSYKYRYDGKTETTEKIKKTGFFNPGDLLFGYGASLKFWEYSYINFSFATIKVFTLPRYYVEDNGKAMAKTNRSYIYSEYGMSLDASIYKKIFNNLIWLSNTNLFANAISKDGVQFYVNNKLTYSFFKYVFIKYDSYVSYDTFYSNRIRLKQIFSVGLLFEKRKNK